MRKNPSGAPKRRAFHTWAASALVATLAMGWAVLTPAGANAAGVAVPLGAANGFAVLAGQSVGNTGASVVTGNLGSSQAASISGFPPGTLNGTMHSGDTTAVQAESDLTTAYNNAAGQAPDANIAGDIGNLTLTPGVYHASAPISLSGTLTLDAQNNPNAVFIFQIESSLTTASDSRVVLVNGGEPCNVFWQVSGTTTLGSDSTFTGNILGLTSISVSSGATIDGRALTRDGSVTLNTDTVTRSVCGGGDTGGDNGDSGGSNGGGSNGGGSNGGGGNGGGGHGGNGHGGGSHGGGGKHCVHQRGHHCDDQRGGGHHGHQGPQASRNQTRNQPHGRAGQYGPNGAPGTGLGGSQAGGSDELAIGAATLGLTTLGVGVYVASRRRRYSVRP